MNKYFNVTINVVNCGNCPFCRTDGYDNRFCVMADVDHHTAIKIQKQNMSEITESCPFFDQLKEM